ncbi:hypothetical protein [Lysobacter capsici]|uniref:hypothetical protein n=1 Tax=Lysobacter capsici TaxID=435897 RepID=UPI003D2F88CA
MRRGQEHHPAELRHRLEHGQRAHQRLAAQTLRDGRIEGLERFVEHLLAAVADQQSRNHPAHTMPHQHRIPTGHIVAFGIVVLERLVQRRRDRRAIGQDADVGRIEHLPQLIVLAQRIVAEDLVGEVDPRLRAAGQAMHQHDHPLVRIVRLIEVDARLERARLLGPQQARQAQPRQFRTRQPHAIGRRIIRRERHLASADGFAVDAIRVVHVHAGLIARQHRVQVVAVEAQGRSHRQIAGVSIRRVVGAGFIGRRERRRRRRAPRKHRDQAGTETVAAVHRAQIVEAERVGGEQGLGLLADLRGFVAVQADAQIQAADLQWRSADLAAAGFERGLSDHVDRAVVVLQHALLARFEHALLGRACGQEQIRVGITRGLDRGVGALVGGDLARSGRGRLDRGAFARLHRGRLAPRQARALGGLAHRRRRGVHAQQLQLRRRRQPRLVGCERPQLLDARRRFARAQFRIEPGRTQRGRRRGAQLAAVERIEIALGGDIAERAFLDLDHRAAAAQQHEQARQGEGDRTQGHAKSRGSLSRIVERAPGGVNRSRGRAGRFAANRTHRHHPEDRREPRRGRR